MLISLDESMFLYVRLFLRKKSQWFRVNKLGYYSDIANIATASKHLALPHISLAESGSSITDIDEALSLLSLDELKEFAKEAKCSGATKTQISASLSQIAKTQTGLSKLNGQLTLDFTQKGVIQRRTDHYIHKILHKTGPLIRLLSTPVSLFHRLHTVFFRSTNYDEKSLATLILAKISNRTFPKYVVQRTANVFHSREELLEYERAIVYKKEVDDILENGVPTKELLQRVKEVFEDVYPRWKEILRLERGKSHDCISEDDWRTMYYLQRYTPGWVYTRLVFKGAYVLSRFHEYEKEWEVLCELLDQKHFRRGRRGEWWERRALIEVSLSFTASNHEERYMWQFDKGVSQVQAKKKWLKLSLETCELALQDPDTHVIFHPWIQKRLLRLERNLGIPKAEQHTFAHVALRPPVVREFRGVRIDDRDAGKKSAWRSTRDPSKEVSVEELCLEQYEALGWKGFHSENGVVTTIVPSTPRFLLM